MPWKVAKLQVCDENEAQKDKKGSPHLFRWSFPQLLFCPDTVGSKLYSLLQSFARFCVTVFLAQSDAFPQIAIGQLRVNRDCLVKIFHCNIRSAAHGCRQIIITYSAAHIS